MSRTRTRIRSPFPGVGDKSKACNPRAAHSGRLKPSKSLIFSSASKAARESACRIRENLFRLREGRPALESRQTAALIWKPCRASAATSSGNARCSGSSFPGEPMVMDLPALRRAVEARVRGLVETLARGDADQSRTVLCSLLGGDRLRVGADAERLPRRWAPCGGGGDRRDGRPGSQSRAARGEICRMGDCVRPSWAWAI